jgi:SAM-dependent methyltransferase
MGGVHVAAEMFDGFAAAPESFDYVLMSHVLEHAHDPRRWIEKAAGLLRRGGILKIMVPHLDSIYRYLGGTRDPYFIPPEHLNHFNERSLGRLCERSGLKCEWGETVSGFGDEVITKRVRLPKMLVRPVKGLTAMASEMLNWGTWAVGIGSVLNFHARKK